MVELLSKKVLCLSFILWIAFGCGPQFSEQDPFHESQAGHVPQILLGLKFVEFVKNDGQPVLDQRRVKRVVEKINPFFSKCSIQFQLEEYLAVDPADYHLPLHAVSVEEMADIREPFDDPSKIVVINTGDWDHSRIGPANAWTAMPGELPAGAVIEGAVATFAGIVAHEIGHYLNLNHVSQLTNLMNPIIYETSTDFHPDQCMQMRLSAQRVRAAIKNQYVGGNPIASLSAAYSG